MTRRAARLALGPALGGLLAAAVLAGTASAPATAATAVPTDQPLTASTRAGPATSREIDYGPSGSRFTATFPTEPKSVADTRELLQGFPKGTHAYAFWESPAIDLFARNAPVPPPPTFLVGVWVLPPTTSSSEFLGSVMKRFGQFPDLTQVNRDGLAGYQFLGPAKANPLNRGSAIADPTASQGELVLRRRTTLYRILVVAAHQPAARAFLASFRTVTHTGVGQVTQKMKEKGDVSGLIDAVREKIAEATKKHEEELVKQLEERLKRLEEQRQQFVEECRIANGAPGIEAATLGQAGTSGGTEDVLIHVVVDLCAHVPKGLGPVEGDEVVFTLSGSRCGGIVPVQDDRQWTDSHGEVEARYEGRADTRCTVTATDEQYHTSAALQLPSHRLRVKPPSPSTTSSSPACQYGSPGLASISETNYAESGPNTAPLSSRKVTEIFQVKVTSCAGVGAGGTPIRGDTVKFSAPCGALSPTSAVTDAKGEAETTWSGTGADSCFVTARELDHGTTEGELTG